MVKRASEHYRLASTTKAKFNGTCAVDQDHAIVKGTLIGRCTVKTNPLKDLYGYACAHCVVDLQESS